jgi:uncharacterized membrane protein
MSALLALAKGRRGHPLHPPLTDATIGAYTVASVLGILAVAGVREARTTSAWWLVLLVGLCLTVPTALTGLLDWLSITRGTALWRVATSHLLAMVSATVFFLIALLVGHGDYVHGSLGGGPLALTLIGFVLLTVGGWLGGTVVFVYGMRVLGKQDEPAKSAVSLLGPNDEERTSQSQGT